MRTPRAPRSSAPRSSALRTSALVVALGLAVAALPAAATAPVEVRPAGLLEVAEGFQLVGHTPLGNRGMNAALAVHGGYAYVGSRTDGKPLETNLTGRGVLVVDIKNPAAPTVVHEIGAPDQGLEGQTSRELRVMPEQELLVVMNLGSNCSELIHACSVRKKTDVFDFYDISGANAAKPKKVATYDPSLNPHEFYVWVDPADSTRVLFFISATGSKRMIVTDVSGARQGQFKELVTWAPNVASSDGFHSMTPSADGTRTHLGLLKGGYYIADTSDVVDRDPGSSVKLITPAGKGPSWAGPGAHSTVPVPGKDVALVTDEVYGDALKALGEHGCPWGWTRMIDTSDPVAPKVIGEYRLPQNQQTFCTTDGSRPSSSYSAHNPTLTDELAFITWHSGGLQVVSLADATKPAKVARYLPDPLPYVTLEDPALSAGQDKVVMWSFPIIKDGLIYVVDLRNGLYVLKYTGPDAADVASIEFLEGNSNLGDALRYDPVEVPAP